MPLPSKCLVCTCNPTCEPTTQSRTTITSTPPAPSWPSAAAAAAAAPLSACCCATWPPATAAACSPAAPGAAGSSPLNFCAELPYWSLPYTSNSVAVSPRQAASTSAPPSRKSAPHTGLRSAQVLSRAGGGRARGSGWDCWDCRRPWGGGGEGRGDKRGPRKQGGKREASRPCAFTACCSPDRKTWNAAKPDWLRRYGCPGMWPGCCFFLHLCACTHSSGYE